MHHYNMIIVFEDDHQTFSAGALYSVLRQIDSAAPTFLIVRSPFQENNYHVTTNSDIRTIMLTREGEIPIQSLALAISENASGLSLISTFQPIMNVTEFSFKSKSTLYDLTIPPSTSERIHHVDIVAADGGDGDGDGDGGGGGGDDDDDIDAGDGDAGDGDDDVCERREVLTPSPFTDYECSSSCGGGSPATAAVIASLQAFNVAPAFTPNPTMTKTKTKTKSNNTTNKAPSPFISVGWNPSSTGML